MGVDGRACPGEGLHQQPPFPLPLLPWVSTMPLACLASPTMPRQARQGMGMALQMWEVGWRQGWVGGDSPSAPPPDGSCSHHLPTCTRHAQGLSLAWASMPLWWGHGTLPHGHPWVAQACLSPCLPHSWGCRKPEGGRESDQVVALCYTWCGPPKGVGGWGNGPRPPRP